MTPHSTFLGILRSQRVERRYVAVGIALLGAIGALTSVRGDVKPVLDVQWGGFADVAAVVLDNDTSGWAVGSSIIRFDRIGWRAVLDTPDILALRDLAFAEGVGWAVGSAGVGWRYENGTWERNIIASGVDLVAVGLQTAQSGFAVGNITPEGRGMILSYEGKAWSQLYSVNTALQGLWVGEGAQAVAVGDNGLLLERTGAQWNRVDVGTDATLYDVVGTSEGEIIAVGGRFGAFGRTRPRQVILSRKQAGTWVTEWDVEDAPLYTVAVDDTNLTA